MLTPTPNHTPLANVDTDSARFAIRAMGPKAKRRTLSLSRRRVAQTSGFARPCPSQMLVAARFEMQQSCVGTNAGGIGQEGVGQMLTAALCLRHSSGFAYSRRATKWGHEGRRKGKRDESLRLFIGIRRYSIGVEWLRSTPYTKALSWGLPPGVQRELESRV